MRYAGIAGRVAIVTGGNHGIGAATARILATNGARVLVSYLRLNDAVEKQDAALMADVAIDLAKGEKAVGRPHKAVSGEGLMKLAQRLQGLYFPNWGETLGWRAAKTIRQSVGE